jgi:D-glycerate 3-kinase
MLGFNPIGPDACDAIDPDLVAVDASLSNGGYDALSALVDAWIVVEVADAEWVRAWRLQAERQTRAEGRPTLSDDEVSDFVDRFMPAYVAYLPGLYARGPEREKADTRRGGGRTQERAVTRRDATRRARRRRRSSGR